MAVNDRNSGYINGVVLTEHIRQAAATKKVATEVEATPEAVKPRRWRYEMEIISDGTVRGRKVPVTDAPPRVIVTNKTRRLRKEEEMKKKQRIREQQAIEEAEEEAKSRRCRIMEVYKRVIERQEAAKKLREAQDSIDDWDDSTEEDMLDDDNWTDYDPENDPFGDEDEIENEVEAVDPKEIFSDPVDNFGKVVSPEELLGTNKNIDENGNIMVADPKEIFGDPDAWEPGVTRMAPLPRPTMDSYLVEPERVPPPPLRVNRLRDKRRATNQPFRKVPVMKEKLDTVNNLNAVAAAAIGRGRVIGNSEPDTTNALFEYRQSTNFTSDLQFVSRDGQYFKADLMDLCDVIVGQNRPSGQYSTVHKVFNLTPHRMVLADPSGVQMTYEPLKDQVVTNRLRDYLYSATGHPALYDMNVNCVVIITGYMMTADQVSPLIEANAWAESKAAKELYKQLVSDNVMNILYKEDINRGLLFSQVNGVNAFENPDAAKAVNRVSVIEPRDNEDWQEHVVYYDTTTMYSTWIASEDLKKIKDPVPFAQAMMDSMLLRERTEHMGVSYTIVTNVKEHEGNGFYLGAMGDIEPQLIRAVYSPAQMPGLYVSLDREAKWEFLGPDPTKARGVPIFASFDEASRFQSIQDLERDRAKAIENEHKQLELENKKLDSEIARKTKEAELEAKKREDAIKEQALYEKRKRDQELEDAKRRAEIYDFEQRRIREADEADARYRRQQQELELRQREYELKRATDLAADRERQASKRKDDMWAMANKILLPILGLAGVALTVWIKIKYGAKLEVPATKALSMFKMAF